MTQKLFNHPLLFSLFAGIYDPNRLKDFLIRRPIEAVPQPDGTTTAELAKRMPFGSNLPSYIPSRNFALALLDIVGGSGAQGGVLSLASVKANAMMLPNGRVRQAILAAIGEAGNDIDRARTSLEAWFDGTMDRISGWYKRETQLILFVIGLLIAIFFNIDVFRIASDLATNNTVRQRLISQVDAAYPNLKPDQKLSEANLQKQISGLSDVIGWSYLEQRMRDDLYVQATQQHPELKGPDPTTTEANRQQWVNGQMVEKMNQPWIPGRIELWAKYIAPTIPGSIPGWLLTALGVSLGAPFWFDLLNKLMVIRSTVKPYEKSPAEGSEDRRGAPPAAERLEPPPAAVPVVPAQAGQQQPAPQQAPEQQPSPEAQPLATIRLAIDNTDLEADTLQLTCDGAPVAVPPDGFVELSLTPGETHVLDAQARRNGQTVAWTRTATPAYNDITMMTAKLKEKGQ